MNKNLSAISPEALDLLIRYDWPGNVRELQNAIERAMVVGKPPSIRTEDWPFQLNTRPKVPQADSLAEVERQHIINILDRTGWNITRAAEILKIDRVTLYNKIEKYGLRK
jgi:DNA-binding NtrC family response regulator